MDDDTAEARLWDAIRDGRRDDVVAHVLSLSEGSRRRVRPRVREHERAVGAHGIGARAPAGEWNGELRQWHHSAAAAAVLGCSSLEQAVTYAPLDPPDSVDLPKMLFPGHVDAFAREWFARYVRNPKAWDRIRGIDAPFEWAHEGLIPPPVDHGAVLEARPSLMDVTLRRIFDVDGIKGASLAQRDERESPGPRMDDFVIPELIRRGHWTADFVHEGIRRALARGQTPYLARWFHGLEAQIAGR